MFIRKIKIGATLAALCLGFLGGTVNAEEDNHRLDDAWKAALMDFEGVVTPQQHATLNSIAYHAAAARLCDGVELDVDKVNKAMNDIASATNEELDDDHKMERVASIVLTLGTAKGLFLAEGSLHKAEFCEAAVKSKSDTENVHFWR